MRTWQMPSLFAGFILARSEQQCSLQDALEIDAPEEALEMLQLRGQHTASEEEELDTANMLGAGMRLGHKSQTLQVNRGDGFIQAYGTGYSWFAGRVTEDTVSFGGADAPGTKFGLLQMGSVSVGDIYPENGESLTDGIMGLAPGCFQTDCVNGNADVISSLVKSGALSSHVFTMCFDAGPEGGGRLYLGPPNNGMPASAVVLPLLDMSTRNSSASLYALNLSGGATHNSDFVFLHLGNQVVGNISTSHDSDARVIVDSGTGGFFMSCEVWSSVCRSVAQALLLDPVFELSNDKSFTERMTAALCNGTFELSDLSTEQVGHLHSLAPDFWFTLGSENVTVPGSTFFYETTPCSGSYQVSWSCWDRPITMLGTAFLWGRTVAFDLSSMSSPSLVLVGPADGCNVDYSEHGNHVKMHAYPGQALSPLSGVYTAEISVGSPPQSFRVQLDTGSEYMLINEDSCRLVGSPACMGHTACNSCFYLSWTRSGKVAFLPFAIQDPYPQICLDYIEPLISRLNMSGSVRNLTAKGPLAKLIPFGWYLGYFHLEDFKSAVATELQPYAKCGATRAACGNLRTFDANSSSTFAGGQTSKGSHLQTFDFHLDPPPFYDPGLTCEPCTKTA